MKLIPRYFFPNSHIIVIILFLKKKFGFILFLPSKGQFRKWNKFKSNLFIFNFNQKRSRESASFDLLVDRKPQAATLGRSGLFLLRIASLMPVNKLRLIKRRVLLTWAEAKTFTVIGKTASFVISFPHQKRMDSKISKIP